MRRVAAFACVVLAVSATAQHNPTLAVRVLERESGASVRVLSPDCDLRLHDAEADTLIWEIERSATFNASVSGKTVRVAWRSGSCRLDSARFMPSESELRFAVSTGRKTRHYRGALILRASGSRLVVVNEVDLETYLRGVLPCEVDTDVPEALKAQAVVSRTFALRSIGRHERDGYDLCSFTHCQVYGGADREEDASDRAVEATHGEVLTFDGRLAEVYFHSTCGGRTAYASDMWNLPDLPYLRSVDDSTWCSRSRHHRWSWSVEQSRIMRAVSSTFRFPIVDIKVTSRTEDGRVDRLALIGPDSSSKTVAGWRFRDEVTRRLGWQTIKSTWLSISSDGAQLTFTGRGLGHGLGMCQHGAIGRAEAGWNYRDILAAYFPGTILEKPDGPLSVGDAR
jgi:stage II sporulation protein D